MDELWTVGRFEKMFKLTQCKLKEWLTYDPNSGIFIWNKDTHGKVKKGDIAGHLNGFGYITIKLLQINYRAHRLAFLYMTGHWPEMEVDHINQNKADNRWCNLRDVNRSTNCSNKSVQKNNQLGEKNISMDRATGRYWVSITRQGIRKNIGGFMTSKEAIKVRNKELECTT